MRHPVHAIYGLIYTLCTNKDDIVLFKKYLLATDTQVFDPHFIVQYLLVPVNTIVKHSLQPWMMMEYDMVNHQGNKY